MKILCADYGVQTYYRLNKAGIFPSQLLYGSVEMENKGYKVEYFQFSRAQNIQGIWHDLKSLYTHDYDVLYLPYIRSKTVFILLFFKLLKLYNHKIIGIQHKTIEGNCISRRWKKYLYRGINRIFFHSPLNLEESVSSRIVCQEQTEVLYWGVQLLYYDNKIKKDSQNLTSDFISTGMENRDFRTLLLGFEYINAPLKIYATKRFGCSDYLFSYNNISNNIFINYVEQKDDTIYKLTQIVANSYCVVVLILEEFCTYCVGHTSIVEALALGKPLIVTDNPYHPIDVEKEGVGLKVKPSDSQSLVGAVNYLKNNREQALEMGRKARKLAEVKYNIDVCAKQIMEAIDNLY